MPFPFSTIKKQCGEIELTPKEYQLIMLLREEKFGKFIIVIHDGEPKRWMRHGPEEGIFDGDLKIK